MVLWEAVRNVAKLLLDLTGSHRCSKAVSHLVLFGRAVVGLRVQRVVSAFDASESSTTPRRWVTLRLLLVCDLLVLRAHREAGMRLIGHTRRITAQQLLLRQSRMKFHRSFIYAEL